MAIKKKYHIQKGEYGSAISVMTQISRSGSGIKEVLEDGTVRIDLNLEMNYENTNQILVDFLSNLLHVPVTNISIIAEDPKGRKLITILGIESEKVQKLILDSLKTEKELK